MHGKSVESNYLSPRHLYCCRSTNYRILDFSQHNVYSLVHSDWLLHIYGKNQKKKRYCISSYSFLPWIVSSPWIVSPSSEATILFWIHLVRKLFKFSFPLCNENFNSFLTRWGNYSRRGIYSREETIWGNTVNIRPFWN